jgi:hypothetical protein
VDVHSSHLTSETELLVAICRHNNEDDDDDGNDDDDDDDSNNWCL